MMSCRGSLRKSCDGSGIRELGTGKWRGKFTSGRQQSGARELIFWGKARGGQGKKH